MNNEVKLWLKNSTAHDDDIAQITCNFGSGTVCKLIHKTIVDLKTNKNHAILWQCTDLSPTIGNQTRWGSGYSMLNKWHRIKANCKVASADDGANIAMPPPSHVFKREAKNTATMLSDINDVAVLLQERLLPLHRSCELHEVLIITAEEGRMNATIPWFRNSFGKVYISPDSTKRPDCTFANAVCKMQKRQAYTLSVDKKLAIDKWLEKPAGNEVQSNLSLADCLSQLRGNNLGQKRKVNEMDNGCNNDDNCFDHVIGSAAEVERLWSIARYILTTSHTSMALLYLKQSCFFV